MSALARIVPVAILAACIAVPAAATADVASQPAFDRAAMKDTYKPIGFFKPGDPLPGSSAPPKADANGLFNPSGQFNAYDTNVYESLSFPSRQADDKTTNDPPGTGDPRPGFCPPPQPGSEFFPAFLPYGKCLNHQLEWLDHYERTMKAVLGDFGVVIKRYKFESPGSGDAGRPGTNGTTSTPGGDSYNISATVPGADNPEEQIIVSGHFDFTDSGPAAAWDSQEGHAEVIRMAKIMADYWRRTGTRPSATVKFMPWDQEETGTVGSTVWVRDNIPPGHESKVRAYFNVDPCAGAYPAFYHGNPGQRIPMTLQLADPANAANAEVAARMKSFNDRAVTIIDEFFTDIDDTVQVVGGTQPLYRPEDRGQIQTAIGGLLLFSSDYRNFEAIGVPFMNLSPDMFGPKADPGANTPEQSNEGVATLHTPRDNQVTLNQLTGPDQSGQTVSDGWLKGMELCAQLESRYMLQPEMGGAQTASTDPVAYFEALPNEAFVKQTVTFDASGSYQYSSVDSRAYDSDLTYEWDFGDGKSAKGKTVTHGFDEVGKYDAKLTVNGGGKKDTMTLPITVVGSTFDPPVLAKPLAEDEDGTFSLDYDYKGARKDVESFLIEEARDAATILTDDATEVPDTAAGTDAKKRWKALPPDEPLIQPWQASDSGSPKVRGNTARSAPRSFYTGMEPGPDNVPTAGPAKGTSVLEFKDSLQLPRGDVEMTYFSEFRNDANDVGRVEVAIDTGATGVPLEWSVVDFTGRDAEGTTCNQSCPTRAAEFSLRRVNLSGFAGRKVRLRFVYALGAPQYANVVRGGWYVDDISITSGSFKEIGDTTAKTFTVAGREKGTYSYRVRAKFADSVRTTGSNVETVNVTVGAPPGTVPSGTAGSGCVAAKAFLTATARPRGRGLRFNFRSAGTAPVVIDVFRTSVGRKTTKTKRLAHFTKRTKAFTWAPRGLRSGVYFVRYRSSTGSGADVRRIVLHRSKGRFRLRRPYSLRNGCGLLRSAVLSSPSFGGTRRRGLSVAYRLGAPARVGVAVYRREGKKALRRVPAVSRPAGKLIRTPIKVRGLRRGYYRIVLVMTRKSGRRETRTLYALRL